MWFLITFLTVWISCVHGQELKCDPDWRKNFAHHFFKPRVPTCHDSSEVTGKTCDFPEIKHGSIYDENRYKEAFPAAIGKYFYYSCDQNFVSPTQSLWTRATCTEAGWQPAPQCRRYCFFPWVENGHSESSGQIRLEGETVKITCDAGYSLPTNESITCEESGWSSTPTCTLGEKCGLPPAIDNGDITSLPLKAYDSGSSVQYQCQALYTLQGSKNVVCSNGQWSKPPKCLDPCVISEDNMNQHNLKFKWVDFKKLYVRTEDAVEFACKDGYFRKTSPESFRVLCREGILVYPTCERNDG